MSEPYEKINPACGETFRQLLETNGTQNELLARHCAVLESTGEKVDAMYKALLGNGNPTDNGLVGQVAGLRAAQRTTWKVIGGCVAVMMAIVAILSVAR